MTVTVYDTGEIEVRVLRTAVSIRDGKDYVYLTLEELADIADAVEQHLEIESAAESIFTEEDPEAGRQGIAEWVDSLGA